MIKGLIFDLNGTLIDILTNEGDPQLYRVTANFLDYYGVKLAPCQLRDLFFELNREQRRESREKYPEFDVSQIFINIIERFKRRPIPDVEQLAEYASIVFRAASRFRLELYDGVFEVLTDLRKEYKLAAVSDGQSLWALPEMHSVDLEHFFSPIIVSGDFGYRKPDLRLYQEALRQMHLQPAEVIFVGNDMYRDVYGAHQAGMKTVFFKSNQGDQTSHGVEADYIIYNFNELPQAVDFLQKSLAN